MMKKFIYIIPLILCLSVQVSAQEENTYYSTAENFISEYSVDFEQLKEKPFEALLETAGTAVKKAVGKPLKIFYKITAVLLMSSFISLFSSGISDKVMNVVNVVTMTVLFTNVFQDISMITEDIVEGLVDVRNFMTAFLPVFAGISFASGEMVTSAVYTGFFMICVVTVANFCISYVIPSVNLFLAAGIASSVSPVIKLESLCEFYVKAVKMAMTAAVSVICFVLTLQTAIAQGQDSLAVKTGKLIVNSAVPIIGSALQSAVGSVYASMGVLKGFFGIAGIMVVINMFLPSIVILAVNWTGYYLTAVLGEILENDTAVQILTKFRQVMEILLSVSVLFMVLLIFSMTVMIKTTQGV